jgi:hypothetical protein
MEKTLIVRNTCDYFATTKVMKIVAKQSNCDYIQYIIYIYTMQIEIIGDMCIGRDERTGCHRLLGSSYTDLSTQSSIKCIFTTCTEQKKDLKRIPQSGLSKRNFIK